MSLTRSVIPVSATFPREAIIVISNASPGLFNIRESNILCDAVSFHHFVNAFAALSSACYCAGLLGHGIGKGNGLGKTSNPRGSVFVTGFNGY